MHKMRLGFFDVYFAKLIATKERHEMRNSYLGWYKTLSLPFVAKGQDVSVDIFSCYFL